jgi:hypothetical protein
MYSITGTTITKQSLSTIWGECGVGAEGGKWEQGHRRRAA